MAVRNGQQYIAGLKDQREVWYRGEVVDDVTALPEFSGAIKSIAHLYDMQHHPEHAATLVVEDAKLGEPIGRAFEFPRNADQLRLKREAYIAWAQSNCEIGRASCRERG